MTKRLVALAVLATACIAVPFAAAGSSGRTLAATTRFSTPLPDQGAVQQIASLAAHRDVKDAALLTKMETIPRAVWLTGGTAAATSKQIKETLVEAALERAVPVFVVYDIPGRDCGGYSAGGAQTTADYEAYIDAVSAAIGKTQAVVLLEPDALANLPSDCGYNLPADQVAQLTADRYTQINYAVDTFESTANPNVSVYLDAGHSAWHGVGDMAPRLVQGGVLKAQGFFSNVSNYQPTAHEELYDTWISDCIAFANNADEGGWRLGHYDWCAGQYQPVGPGGSYVVDFSQATIDTVNAWYASNLGAATPTVHFVIDTSRNGQGAWDWASAGYPDSGTAQDWCNPPGRGLGARPTANTGVPLLDALLWVKTPGESDGSCTRGTAGPSDPEWGITDPAAGAWFPQQALQLAQLASPALLP
ncbi:MAG TPA: glycoside hydrolase family 6 protein [Gaiellaceae bacterium]|nr:glycoside hydrolase family 6 protein [Gaiellaceae bacterium]